MKLTLFAVLLLPVASLMAHAQANTSTWQGSFVGDGERHRMVLQADQAADGRWTVRTLAVDFLPEAIQVDTATFQDGHIAAVTNAGKGTYDAHLDSGNLDGIWTWNKQSFPVKLERVPNEAAWHTPMNYQYHHQDVTFT